MHPTGQIDEPEHRPDGEFVPLQNLSIYFRYFRAQTESARASR